MEEIIFEANRREVIGKGVKKLRRDGMLPAVVYGHNIDPISISLDYREASKTLDAISPSALVVVDIEGEVEAIHALNDELLAAFKEMDIDRVMAVMAEDVAKMSTTDAFFRDREGVKEFILDYFERGRIPSWEVAKVEVANSGELAYALTKLDISSVNEDQTVRHIYMGSFQILKKQTDGSWKIAAFY